MLEQFNGTIQYNAGAAFIIGVQNPPPALIHKSTPTNFGSGATYFQSKGKQPGSPVVVLGQLSQIGTQPCIFFITGS
jgi:hypothetical protein